MHISKAATLPPKFARRWKAVGAGSAVTASVLAAVSIFGTVGQAAAATSVDGLTITVTRSSDFVGRDTGYAFAKFSVTNKNANLTVDENSGLSAGAAGGTIVAYEFTRAGVEDDCQGLTCYGGPQPGQTETVNLAMRPADGSAPSTLTATVAVPYWIAGDPTRHYLRKSVSFRVG